MDTHVRTPESRRNVNTEIFDGVRPGGAPGLRQAYTLACAIAAARQEATVGHRLVWVRGPAFACTTLEASAAAYAVVGRHTECDVQLPDDPFLALRHVIVRSIALPSGGVALRVIDLHTGTGFVLPDGSTQTSIFAEGPIAFALGEYALVALPNDPRGGELPAEMPAPEVATPPAVREQLDVLAEAMSPYRQNARPARTSRITLMPRLLMVGEPLPPSLGRLAGGEYGVTLARGERRATVSLSDEDLARGVLIGRSDKCHSEQLRQVTDIGTSRAHVLVLREGPVVCAYDLASTRGTYSGGERVRRVILPPSGATLWLGRGPEAVQLGWHPHA